MLFYNEKDVLSFLYLFPSPSDLLDPVLVIHHGDDLLLVVGYRSYGDVSHYAELSTVVEVLILETNEVPHESSEYLQKLKDTAYSLRGNCAKLKKVFNFRIIYTLIFTSFMTRPTIQTNRRMMSSMMML